MFRHISKITLKYTSSLFSQENQEYISPKLIELWLQDMQIGLDALLNDELLLAEDTFKQQQSPFHAFGLGLLIYSKAMLAMEKTKIDQAIDYILHLEITLKNYYNKKKRKTTIHSSFSVPLDFHSLRSDDDDNGIECHFQLLHANCILMSATLQFLRESWIDSLKAAYDLRKAYKIYQYLFETMTGVSIEEYESRNIRTDIVPITRRTVSCDNSSILQQQKKHIYDETIIHGAYFGIGLFNVLFSTLPSKVGKILNGFGFHSSRTTATCLLLKSYKSQTMYSSISSLVLLSFYTNISIYIQPDFNQFLRFKDAKIILDELKQRYPNGPIWYLLEGKFKKLQGNWDRSISLFKKAKNPIIPTLLKEKDTMEDEDYFRNSSITEFTQFKSFAIYELGWSYIYAGDYFQASESFFCLESMCNWSRIFYHYISTCCMIADGLFDKAVLEIRQIINMLDQKKKLNSRISSNENYAESRVRSWLDISTKMQLSLRDTLQFKVINPIWELVYLWNGTAFWKHDVIMEIQSRKGKEDPMIYILLGVIERDVEKKNDKALEYFYSIVKCKKEQEQEWIIPYAMYEIAATYCNVLLKDDKLRRRHLTEYKLIIMEWLKAVENYYIENNDMEWETRMQSRCQLLIESCNNIL